MASPGPVSGQGGAAPTDAVMVGMSFFDLSGRLGNGVALEVGYRPAWRLAPRIHPRIGAMVSSDGGAYAYLGLQARVSLHPRLSLVPSLAAGAFDAGRDTDLGSALEFRSGLELEVRGPGDDAIILAFYHLSNAGLAERNPGMEVLGLAYSVTR